MILYCWKCDKKIPFAGDAGGSNCPVCHVCGYQTCEHARVECATRADPALPFDPATLDVVCARLETGEKDLTGKPRTRVACNINQRIVHHSPTGFEWGYGCHITTTSPEDAAKQLRCALPPGA